MTSTVHIDSAITTSPHSTMQYWESNFLLGYQVLGKESRFPYCIFQVYAHFSQTPSTTMLVLWAVNPLGISSFGIGISSTQKVLSHFEQ